LTACSSRARRAYGLPPRQPRPPLGWAGRARRSTARAPAQTRASRQARARGVRGRTACQPGEGTDEGVAVAGRPAGLALPLRTGRSSFERHRKTPPSSACTIMKQHRDHRSRAPATLGPFPSILHTWPGSPVAGRRRRVWLPAPLIWTERNGTAASRALDHGDGEAKAEPARSMRPPY
jgi:hypothetical protein